MDAPMDVSTSPSAYESVKDVFTLGDGVADGWKSFDLGRVNGQRVRFRTMRDWTANWHVHPDSDEAFVVISGTFFLDTDDGTREVTAGQMTVARAGIRHRGRCVGQATMLVIDSIGS
ncbi:MAG: cupin domain-containing protein [Alphaproteobacteria bacterium]|nr:cupin domain-containing protein [Alphaproteobacteria bacterium]